jgi:hypothetical protein
LTLPGSLSHPKGFLRSKVPCYLKAELFDALRIATAGQYLNSGNIFISNGFQRFENKLKKPLLKS